MRVRLNGFYSLSHHLLQPLGKISGDRHESFRGVASVPAKNLVLVGFFTGFSFVLRVKPAAGRADIVTEHVVYVVCGPKNLADHEEAPKSIDKLKAFFIKIR